MFGVLPAHTRLFTILCENYPLLIAKSNFIAYNYFNFLNY